MGIKFKIQGRNAPSDDWVDIETKRRRNDEFLAFGDYLYHRVWVKPTAKATTTVSSSNVVTLTLSNLTEENVTTSFTGADPFDINETTKRIRIRRNDEDRDGSVYGNTRYGNVYERRDGNDGRNGVRLRNTRIREPNVKFNNE